MNETESLIHRYFEAFNAHNENALVVLLGNDIAHDINEGERAVGIDAFTGFRARMNRCYREQISELRVMVDGDTGCAEFICSGVYLATDEGLPEAHGQPYAISAVAIFQAREGKIVRITSYYNLRAWIKAVSG